MVRKLPTSTRDEIKPRCLLLVPMLHVRVLVPAGMESKQAMAWTTLLPVAQKALKVMTKKIRMWSYRYAWSKLSVGIGLPGWGVTRNQPRSRWYFIVYIIREVKRQLYWVPMTSRHRNVFWRGCISFVSKSTTIFLHSRSWHKGAPPLRFCYFSMCYDVKGHSVEECLFKRALQE